MAIIIVLLFERFGKILSKKLKKGREESKEVETEQHREIIKTEAKVSKEDLKNRKN